MAKIPRLAAYEQARRALRRVCEPDIQSLPLGVVSVKIVPLIIYGTLPSPRKAIYRIRGMHSLLTSLTRRQPLLACLGLNRSITEIKNTPLILRGAELGYSPVAKIPRLAAYEQARRALRRVCEPIPCKARNCVRHRRAQS